MRCKIAIFKFSCAMIPLGAISWFLTDLLQSWFNLPSQDTDSK